MEVANIIYPSILYRLITFFFVWAFIPMIFIMHRKVFHDPEIIKVSEDQIKVVNFKPGGYPSSYYCILTFFIMMVGYGFGFFQYVLTSNSKFLMVILITFLVELSIIFIDYTDKIMPFNLQTMDGFWIYFLIALLIVCGAGSRIMEIHV